MRDASDGSELQADLPVVRVLHVLLGFLLRRERKKNSAAIRFLAVEFPPSGNEILK